MIKNFLNYGYQRYLLMKVIHLNCTCGEKITYEIDDEKIKAEFGRSGLLPILVSHNDHFITAYLDTNLKVRSVERVLLVKDEDSSIVVKSSSSLDIENIVQTIMKKNNPQKHFLRYLSSILQKLTKPEDLFISGRITGDYLWKKRREPILKMGASFSIEPHLILKTEIIPIYQNTAKIKVLQEEKNTVVLNDTLSPQFMIGIAQGILDAIQLYMQNKITIKIEYVMSGSTVFLTIND